MSEDNGSTGRRQAYMNARATQWAWMQIDSGKVGRSSERLVLLSLARHASAEGAGWIGQATIAAEAGISINTVGSALSALEKAGLVKRERRGRKGAKGGGRGSDLYWLLGTQSDIHTQEDLIPTVVSKDDLSPNQREEGMPFTQPLGEVTPNHWGGSTKARSTTDTASGSGTVIETPTQIAMSKLGCTEAEAAAVIETIKREKAERGQKIRSLRGLLNHMPTDELRELLPYQASRPIYIDGTKFPGDPDDGEAYAAWCRSERERRRAQQG